MKSPLKKLRTELQGEARKVREERAAIELKPELVRMAIHNAAKAGLMMLRVKMPSNLDVSNTAAAAQLDAWCKNEGLGITWEKREVEREDGRRDQIIEPEISWQPKA